MSTGFLVSPIKAYLLNRMNWNKNSKNKTKQKPPEQHFTMFATSSETSGRFQRARCTPSIHPVGLSFGARAELKPAVLGAPWLDPAPAAATQLLPSASQKHPMGIPDKPSRGRPLRKPLSEHFLSAHCHGPLGTIQGKGHPPPPHMGHLRPRSQQDARDRMGPGIWRQGSRSLSTNQCCPNHRGAHPMGCQRQGPCKEAGS